MVVKQISFEVLSENRKHTVIFADTVSDEDIYKTLEDEYGKDNLNLGQIELVGWGCRIDSWNYRTRKWY